MRVASSLATTVGALALLTALVGSIAGFSSYVLYTANVISSNTSANLILVSVLGSLLALPIGFAAWRWAERCDQEGNIAQVAMALAGGTLGVWIVVVAVALGK